MKCAALAILLAIAGCAEKPPPMTNDQIIAAIKKCHDADLTPQTFTTMVDPRIRLVQCNLKDAK